MNSTCRVSSEELRQDSKIMMQSAEIAEIAIDQFSRVESMAGHLLSGKSFFDSRKKYNGSQVVGEINCEFSFKKIGDIVSEELPDDVLQAVYLGSPGGIQRMQKLIGDCARRVAFDALNLWGSPFTDYDDLRSEWEQAQ